MLAKTVVRASEEEGRARDKDNEQKKNKSAQIV